MIKYEVGLCNVWWNNFTIDTRFFETLKEQAAYFENKVGGIYSPPTNFPMNNNIDSYITFKDPASRDINTVLSMNYCVVRSHEEGSSQYSYRYYFITKIEHDSGYQYSVNISLDDIQTNYFKYKEQIAPCIVSRANLNRFVKSTSSTVKFDTTPESILFEPEDINLTKILQKSENIDFYSSDWENENIAAWCYCFIDSTVEYSVASGIGKISGNRLLLSYYPDLSYKSISSAVAVIAYPLYKSDKYLYFSISGVSDNLKICVEGFDKFSSDNKHSSYYFNYKISKVPPFWWNSENVTIDSNGNAKISGNPDLTDSLVSFNNCKGLTVSGAKYGLITAINQVIFGCDTNINLDYTFEFNKTDLKGKRDYKFDPKIYSIGKSISLMTPDGESFEYDPLKIGKTNINIKYDEVLNPNVTSFYFRYSGDNSKGLYRDTINDNFIGIVNSADYSLPLSNSAYSEFIANNKNAFLTSYVGMINPLMQGNVTGVATSAIGGTVSNLLKMDQLQNAPGTIKSAKLSPILDIRANGFNYNVDYSSAAEAELKLASERFDLYGYSYNRLDKLSNVDNIRKYHNYVSAEIVTIDAPMSNLEKSRLIDKLKEVRFWNVDTVSYDNENYERWLDD